MSLGWDRHSGGSLPIHVVPSGDLRDHVIDGSPCPCLPMTIKQDDSNDIVRHNAYDGREVGEVCRRSLDSLASALTNHAYEWSETLRDDFDHAINILNMHWPEK